MNKIFLTSIAAIASAVSVTHANAGPGEVAEKNAAQRNIVERQVAERVVSDRQINERETVPGLDVDVRFEIATGEFAELELVRTVDEEAGENQLTFTGRTVSEDGKVLIESFTIGTNMAEIARVSDAYFVKRQQENAVAWAGGGPDSFEFLTLDGKGNPSTVIAGGGEKQLGVRVDIFRGQKSLQREYELAGGEGSAAVAIALRFRDMHTNASRGNERGGDDVGCTPTFTQCLQAAKCTCGGSQSCCGTPGSSESVCNVKSFSYDWATCKCSFECHPPATLP